MSLNKVMLIGRVGQDPQIRQAGENKVAAFTLATSEKYRDRNGEVKEQTEWHNIVIWGKMAETAEKYVTKGLQLYVEGRIKTEKYTANDGTDRYTVKVYATSMQLLGSKSEGQSQQNNASQQSAPSYQNRHGSTPMPVDDDLPEGDGLPF